jgi:hypothetical protein
MGLVFRRLWRTFGWLGLLLLAFSIVVLVLLGSGDLVWDSQLIQILRPVVLLIVGLGVAAGIWGNYEKSVETNPYRKVLNPLLASREEFVLLLRPFGSDGEALVPWLRDGGGKLRFLPFGNLTPTLTLEQVVAAAARRRLGIAAYAMVDQDRTLAPPGPIYLRAPHSEWKIPASALIRRAHTIVILLPPGQELRAAMEWELQEIIRWRRQSRVLVVLPPSDRREYGHAELRRQAAVLLAALEGLPSGIANVPTTRVEHFLKQIPDDLLVVKVRPDGGALFWYSERRRWRKVASSTYASSLAEALDANEEEFKGQGFSARYGRTGPPRIR